MLIVSALYLIFQLPSVQTYAAKRSARYFSKELNTQIAVEAVEIDFWNTIYFDDFYLEDLNEDTLLFFKRLEVELGLFDWQEKKVTCDLVLHTGKIQLRKQEELNYQFLIDYFQRGASNTDKKIDWDISINKLTVLDSEFSFDEVDKEKKSSGLDFSHIAVQNFNLSAQELTINNDSIQCKFNRLSFNEKKGFALANLSAQIAIANGLIKLNELALKTENTELSGNFNFSAKDFKAYQNFNSEVKLNASVKYSSIATKDIAYFAPSLEGIDKQVELYGDIKGTVDNLHAENLKLELNANTRLVGNVSLRGLPDVANTIVFLDLDELTTNAEGIRTIPLPPFSEGKTVALSENFDRLGLIRFNGNFTGYISDFVAYGKFQTELGIVHTDLLFKDKSQNEYTYSGKVSASDFNMGKFLGIDSLNKVNLDLSMKGEGVSRENINAEVEGMVNSLVFKNYNYKNILLNGNFQKETFNGEFKVDDKNLEMIFKGKIDVSDQSPIANFNVEVNKANLLLLNLFNKGDSVSTVAFNASVDAIGFDIDRIKGIATIKDLSYRDSKQKHSVEKIQLSVNYNEEERFIDIKSNILDASIKGNYKLKEAKETYNSYLNYYFPNEKYQKGQHSSQKINFSIKTKDTAPLTQIFLPELSIQSGTTLEGNLITDSYTLNTSLKTGQVIYNDKVIDSASAKLYHENDSLKLKMDIAKLTLQGNQTIKNITFRSLLNDSIHKGTLEFNRFGSSVGETRVNFNHLIANFQQMELNLYDSYTTIHDSVWLVSNQNSVLVDSSLIKVSNLSIGDGSQFIYLDGTVSKSLTDTLAVQLKNIDLSFISSLLPPESIDLKGTANGNAKLTGGYGNPALTANLMLDKLFVNDIEIGSSSVSSVWMPEDKALLVNGNFGEEEQSVLNVNGIVYPLKDENSLDLVLSFNRFPLLLVQPYLKGYLSDMKGELNGELVLNGKKELPLVKGVLDLNDAAFKLDYLNTYYTINDKIFIEPDYIGFNLIKVYDSNGSSAIATGSIFHDNYSNFNFDLGLDFNHFLALNTSSANNDLYYGKGTVSGFGNIFGYADQLMIELDIKSEKNSSLKIPLTQGVEVSNSSFLIFTNSPTFEEKTEELDLSGIELDIDLEITPEADVQIIFDEQVGDVIEATGEGNLKLEINRVGDFNIFGQYTVEQGEYLFTLQKIVNKRLSLARGSRISWDGNPYRATLDMQAIYNLRAPLVDLFPDDTTSGFKRRIPIELELKLSDYLLNPNISFDIRLPTADENTKRQLESILYLNSNEVNPQEMNQQVFGLLVLNRFLPSASSVSAAQNYNRGTPGINNGYEFVSNQLSNLFSKVSDQFDVGVKYRPGDELNADELDLSLTTEILNNRLVLDGNFGFSGDSPQIENQNASFVGEFTAEFKISADGRYRVRGFNRSVTNSLLQFNSPYTQGVGLFYREEFDKVGELWKKYFRKREK